MASLEPNQLNAGLYLADNSWVCDKKWIPDIRNVINIGQWFGMYGETDGVSATFYPPFENLEPTEYDWDPNDPQTAANPYVEECKRKYTCIDHEDLTRKIEKWFDDGYRMKSCPAKKMSNRAVNNAFDSYQIGMFRKEAAYGLRKLGEMGTLYTATTAQDTFKKVVNGMVSKLVIDLNTSRNRVTVSLNNIGAEKYFEEGFVCDCSMDSDVEPQNNPWKVKKVLNAEGLQKEEVIVYIDEWAGFETFCKENPELVDGVGDYKGYVEMIGSEGAVAFAYRETESILKYTTPPPVAA